MEWVPLMAAADRADLEKAITYLGNNLGRMGYAACAAAGLPIGSRVTEAACERGHRRSDHDPECLPSHL